MSVAPYRSLLLMWILKIAQIMAGPFKAAFARFLVEGESLIVALGFSAP
jgi:hypothetical protein